MKRKIIILNKLMLLMKLKNYIEAKNNVSPNVVTLLAAPLSRRWF